MTKVHTIQVPIPFPLKWVNCYYIDDSIPTLIDTGVNTDEGLEAIQSAVQATGGSLSDLRRIILTHGHLDHMGLAGRLAEISGAEVFIHKWDKAKLVRDPVQEAKKSGKAFSAFFVEAGVPGAPIDSALETLALRFKHFFSPIYGEKVLEGEEVFDFDDFRLQVIHTPGHSPGSISLLNPDDGTFFSGDTLLEKISSNAVVEVVAPTEVSRYRSLASYQDSLNLVTGLAVKSVLPGHGNTFSDHRGRVEQLQAHHEERKAEVLAVLRDYPLKIGKKYPLTQFTLAMEMFPDLKGFHVFLGLSEVRGHLEMLEDDGLVASRLEANRRIFSLCE